MFEGIERIDSSGRQRPSDCEPGEVANALRALAFAESADLAQAAYHRLLFAVGNDHRGSYFPVVLEVVSYLGEILVGGSPWGRLRTLDVLIDLLASFGPDPEVVSTADLRVEDLSLELRTRVLKLTPTLELLAGASSTPDVQALARELLAYLAESD